MTLYLKGEACADGVVFLPHHARSADSHCVTQRIAHVVQREMPELFVALAAGATSAPLELASTLICVSKRSALLAKTYFTVVLQACRGRTRRTDSQTVFAARSLAISAGPEAHTHRIRGHVLNIEDIQRKIVDGAFCSPAITRAYSCLPVVPFARASRMAFLRDWALVGQLLVTVRACAHSRTPCTHPRASRRLGARSE